MGKSVHDYNCERLYHKYNVMTKMFYLNVKGKSRILVNPMNQKLVTRSILKMCLFEHCDGDKQIFLVQNCVS